MARLDLFVLSLVFVSLLQFVTSYRNFQSKIPNGNIVPYPCKSGQIWEGVGHITADGTGTRNPFGRAFEAAGYQWTVQLCRADSDGDGIYNGQELGDPDCVWKENEMPKIKEGLSHPGICDPWNNTVCSKSMIISPKYSTQGPWLKDMCRTEGFQCPALADKNIMTVTTRLPVGTSVPAKVTIYKCHIFDLYALGVPKDRDFHMVAVTPVLDNRNVVHHMVVFGCTDDTPIPEHPFECGMTPSLTCQEFLHVWTVGIDGECYHPESGVKIGKSGFKKISIQLHWNNADQRPDFTDSSGVVLHYTPNLKRYDAGVFLVGSTMFYLPPNQQHVTVNSTCASGCTKQVLRGPINITSAWNHMHYAGNDMIIEIKRQNVHVGYLTNDPVYSYDSPQIQIYSKPFELYPGDELVTQCGFSTIKRNKTVSWGDATLDEMCFGFITYYPKQNMTQSYCLDKLGISLCEPSSLEGCYSLGRYLKQLNSTAVFSDVMKSCEKFNPCVQECKDTLVKYMKTEPCMKGNIWQFIQNTLARVGGPGPEFLSRVASCRAEAAMAMNSPALPDTGTNMAAPATFTAFLTASTIILQMYS